MLEAALTVCKAIITVGGLIPSAVSAIKDAINEWKHYVFGLKLDQGAAKMKVTQDTTDLENATDSRPTL